MKKLKLFDSFLLNKFQLVSDWFQDIFGITNFKISYFFNLLAWILITKGKVIPFALKNQPVFSILNLFLTIYFSYILILLLICFVLIEKVETSNPIFKNLIIDLLLNTRLVLLCLVFLLSLLVFSDCIQLSMASDENIKKYINIFDAICSLVTFSSFSLHIYFGCCTPKPHKPSKLKKQLQKIKESIEQVGASFRIPSPAM